jgi:hypothetical protein
MKPHFRLAIWIVMLFLVLMLGLNKKIQVHQLKQTPTLIYPGHGNMFNRNLTHLGMLEGMFRLRFHPLMIFWS